VANDVRRGAVLRTPPIRSKYAANRHSP